MTVAIYLGPVQHALLKEAVVDNGGTLVDLDRAEAIIWTNPFEPAELVAALTPRVRWVSLPMSGVDRYIAAGIIDGDRQWTATKGVYGDAVSEHAVALLLASSRHIVSSARRRTWVPDPGWRLRGETVAIIGTGGIGGSAANKLAALGARTIGINRRGRPATGLDEVRPLDSLLSTLQEARATIVAVPFTRDTVGLLGMPELSALGSDGVLVNVARGEIVDTTALVLALESGVLGFAALDVTDPEPLPDDHPLWTLPNAIVTPHSGNPFSHLPWEPNVVEYATHVARNVGAFIAGTELDGLVDRQVGY